MAVHWKWVAKVRRKLRKSKPRNTIIVVHINNSRSLSIGGSTTGGDEEESVKAVETLEAIEEKGCEETVERTEGGVDQNVDGNQTVDVNQNADGNQLVEGNQNADGNEQNVKESQNEEGNQNADGNEQNVEEIQNADENGDTQLKKEVGLSEQQIAAIKIQSFFRGYLARRAFQALRSLVKMQAMVRGVRARKQSHIALNCMQALVRLQVRVRSRQLLSSVGDNSPLNDSSLIKEVEVQRHVAAAPIPLST